MKKLHIQLNTHKEKAVAALSLAVAGAILFDGKKKKPQKRKGFVSRTMKNYGICTGLIESISSRAVLKKVKSDNDSIIIEQADIIEM